jgi:hypothetical protein
VALRVMGGDQSFYSAKQHDENASEYLFVYTAEGETYVLPWKGDIIRRSVLGVEAAKYSPYRITMQG